MPGNHRDTDASKTKQFEDRRKEEVTISFKADNEEETPVFSGFLAFTKNRFAEINIVKPNLCECTNRK